MSRKTIGLTSVTAVAVALVGGSALAAVTISSNLDGLSDDTAAATLEPTVLAEPVAAPVEGDVDGDGKRSGWEREQLAKSAYVLANGTEIPLHRNAPDLPAEVKAKVIANAAAAGDVNTVSGFEASVAAEVAAFDVLAAEEAKTGKRLIPVWFIWDGSTNPHGGGDAAGAGTSSTRDGAVAIAESWNASKANRYSILVS